MSAGLVWSQHAQGTPEWLAERRGVVTASRFKDARGKLKSGQPDSKSVAYAYDLARERDRSAPYDRPPGGRR